MLTSLRSQGLVKEFGVSNMNAAQTARLQRHLDFPLVANQLEMSLDRRDWLKDGVLVNTRASAAVGSPVGTVEYCVANGVRLQAWGALAQGRFTGRQETEGEHATAELLRTLAKAKDTTPETILLWWLQRHPARIAPILGTGRPERIRPAATRPCAPPTSATRSGTPCG